MFSENILTEWTAVAMLSYVLLIASMSMRQMLPLRLLAIGSGVFGVLYGWFYLKDWVISSWESAFVLVNVVQVAILTREHFRGTQSPDEERLRKSIFSQADNHEFVSLMKIARWHDFVQGDQLTIEGKPVPHLMLLVKGSVQVEINGHAVATCRTNDFIGELSFLSGSVANATTIALSNGRYVSFESDELHSLVLREPGLERFMQQLLNVNLVDKLRSTSLNTA